MPEKHRLEIYPSRELLLQLDRWRIEQPDAPSRAEAGRLLLAQALEAKLTQRPAQTPARKRQRAAAE